MKQGNSYTVVFTDGAAKGNPGPGGWAAILRFPDGSIEELGGAEAHTPNNRMEMKAAIKALDRLGPQSGPVVIHTDSSYLVNGATRWLEAWKRRGWRSSNGGDVANQDLWRTLDELLQARADGAPVVWRQVRGHAGVAGNERADSLASALAQGEDVDMYCGPECSYAVEIDWEPSTEPARCTSRRSTRAEQGQQAAMNADKATAKRRSRARAYSYLSVVDGVVRRHRSWNECESAVRGRSRARFKKALNPGEEQEILRDWGYSPKDVQDG